MQDEATLLAKFLAFLDGQGLYLCEYSCGRSNDYQGEYIPLTDGEKAAQVAAFITENTPPPPTPEEVQARLDDNFFDEEYR